VNSGTAIAIDAFEGSHEQVSTDISSLSNQELDQLFAESLTNTAKGLHIMALCFSEKLRRGLPTPDIRSGILIYIPAIAQGKLAAEAVVTFAGMPSVINRLKGMNLEEQRKFAAGKRIEVAERDENGEIVFEKKPLALLTCKQVIRAIDFGQVRSRPAQINSLKNEVITTRRPPKQKRKVKISVDKDTGTLIVHGIKVEVVALESSLIKLGYRLEKIDQ